MTTFSPIFFFKKNKARFVSAKLRFHNLNSTVQFLTNAETQYGARQKQTSRSRNSILRKSTQLIEHARNRSWPNVRRWQKQNQTKLKLKKTCVCVYVETTYIWGETWVWPFQSIVIFICVEWDHKRFIKLQIYFYIWNRLISFLPEFYGHDLNVSIWSQTTKLRHGHFLFFLACQQINI